MRRLVAVFAALAILVALLGLAPPARAATETFSQQMNCGFATEPEFDADNVWDSEITIDAPDAVAPGESFQVVVDASPMLNGPVNSYAEQAEWSGRATVDGTPDVESAIWLNPEQINAAMEYDMGELVFDITAGDSGEVEFELTGIHILALGRITVWCFAYDDAGEPETQSVTIPIDGDAQPTPTTEATATTTTTEAPEATTTTTEAEVEPIAAGPLTAKQVTASASVTYQCTNRIVTESDSTFEAQVSISAPDLANEGQELAVGMQVSPGPPNKGDTVQPGALSASGTVVAEEAGNAADIGGTMSGNAATVTTGQPLMVGAIRGTYEVATGAGGTVDYRPGAISYEDSLQGMTVDCVPEDAPVLLSTEIVDGEVDQAQAQELPYTGWEEPHVKLIWGSIALYLGYLVVTAMPRTRRKRVT